MTPMISSRDTKVRENENYSINGCLGSHQQERECNAIRLQIIDTGPASDRISASTTIRPYVSSEGQSCCFLLSLFMCFPFLVTATTKHAFKAFHIQIIPRMSRCILVPNMGTDLQSKRSDDDVPNKKTKLERSIKKHRR